MIRILIADDHMIIRKGLKQILLEEYPSAIIEEANDAEEVISKTMTGSYSIIICDLSMPRRSGLDVVLHMKQNFPGIPVLILSVYPENQYGIRVIKAGASGYLNKEASPVELIRAVQRILEGRKYISSSLAEKMTESLVHDNLGKAAYEFLSNREFDIFKRIASGNRVYEIAERLSLSSSTVTSYRARILTKMGMKTNAQLTRYYLDNQLT
jgi:two-component system, NarL family, invasion response regulator UvrY